MSHSTMNIRHRAAALAGAVAIVGTAGAGLASTASAATGSGAQSTLAAIKFCESSNNYQAQNPSSTASGAYQFLDTTWQGLSAAKGYSKAKYVGAGRRSPRVVQPGRHLPLGRQLQLLGHVRPLGTMCRAGDAPVRICPDGGVVLPGQAGGGARQDARRTTPSS